jgi:hypothetical protein
MTLPSDRYRTFLWNQTGCGGPAARLRIRSTTSIPRLGDTPAPRSGHDLLTTATHDRLAFSTRFPR